MRDDREANESLSEATRFQRDLYLYWRAVRDANRLALTPRGHVASLGLRRVRARLHAPDPRGLPPSDGPETEDPRLYFVRRLLERLRLLRPSRDERALLAAEDGEMGRYVALPLAERLRLAVRLWLAGGWWQDGATPSMLPPRILTPAPPRIAIARRRLVDLLRERGPGAELALPAIQLPGKARTGARMSPAARARPALEAADAADATARAALLGPLAWLGFVGPSEGAASDAVTLTRAVLALGEGGEPVHLPERRGPLTALPNLSLIAYPPFSALELWLLDACAEEESLQQTATFRLTRESLARAHRAGMSGQVVAERLEALIGSGLPSNVRVTLDDWMRHAARLRFTRGAELLRVADPAVLDGLLGDARAGGWIGRRLAPTIALLTPNSGEEVRGWLLRRGELPAVERPPDGSEMAGFPV
jgi:hypothetical protein